MTLQQFLACLSVIGLELHLQHHVFVMVSSSEMALHAQMFASPCP